jgi:hypothetical protein
MSAWEGAGFGAADGRELLGDDVAGRGTWRFLAGADCGLRVAAGRGREDGCTVDVPWEFLVPVAPG